MPGYRPMDKAVAYAVSAFIVGFGIWILVAGLNPTGRPYWVVLALIPTSDRSPERVRRSLNAWGKPSVRSTGPHFSTSCKGGLLFGIELRSTTVDGFLSAF